MYLWLRRFTAAMTASVALVVAALTLDGPAAARPAHERPCGAHIPPAACAVLTHPAPAVPLGPDRNCAATCSAAYTVIARALPHDRDSIVAHAILATPNFSYPELNKAMHIPTARQIEEQWRRFCNLAFPRNVKLSSTCFLLIRGDTASASGGHQS